MGAFVFLSSFQRWTARRTAARGKRERGAGDEGEDNQSRVNTLDVHECEEQRRRNN